jgi:hypothetical protein
MGRGRWEGMVCCQDIKYACPMKRTDEPNAWIPSSCRLTRCIVHHMSARIGWPFGTTPRLVHRTSSPCHLS